MLPLHAASAIVLSMCMFVVGFGLGYAMRKPKVITRTVTIPKGANHAHDQG